MIQRSEIKELTARLKEPRKFIQVIVGGDRGEKQQRPHQRRTASLQQQIQAAASLCRRKRGNASGRFPANGLASPVSVIHYVKDRRYIRQKAGRIIYAHRLCGLRRWVVFRYAALRWGGVISVSGFCNLTSLGLIP